MCGSKSVVTGYRATEPSVFYPLVCLVLAISGCFDLASPPSYTGSTVSRDSGTTTGNADGDTESIDAGGANSIPIVEDASIDAPNADVQETGNKEPDRPTPPVIYSIEGDGSERPIMDDRGVLDGVVGRIDATRRFRTQWIIQGEQLDTVTMIKLEHQPAESTVLFDGLSFDEGGTSMTRALTLPTSLVAGLFIMTLTSPQGDAQAQVFVLQGEQGERGEKGMQGPPGDSVITCADGGCTLKQNLSIEGNVSAVNGQFSGQTTASSGFVGNIIGTVSTDCPAGYQRDMSGSVPASIVLCKKAMGLGRFDEMVKVGDFWIDRYEASHWEKPDCTGIQYGSNPGDPYGEQSWDANWTKPGAYPMYPCSLVGVIPSFSGQWLWAAAACALSGKSLCRNAQWQIAALGTVDPGKFPYTGPDIEGEKTCGFQSSKATLPESGPCNTCSRYLRGTGQAGAIPGGADSCISLWGAEDMVGNLAELTAEWYSIGDLHDWTGTPKIFENEGVWYWEYLKDHYAPDAGLKEYLPHDSTWNIPGVAYHSWGGEQDGTLTPGLPGVGVRGGSYEDGNSAGILAINVAQGPASVYAYNGIRCCINR